MTTFTTADRLAAENKKEILNLPNVTLVIVETRCHELARLAIEDSIKNIEFGEILICSDREIKTSKPNRWVKVPDFDSYDEFGLYSVTVLPKLINTEFSLFIQFDSWVLDEAMWTDEYLKYDYIGPPWWHKDGNNVGCGGFSLASTKFLNFIADNMDKYPLKQPFDDVICRQNRLGYESKGFKFAPTNLAVNFGFERVGYKGQHFGFHGMFNWPIVLTWTQLVERVKNCSPYHYNKKDALPEIFNIIGSELTKKLLKDIKAPMGQGLTH